jgi:hypothetical protein
MPQHAEFRPAVITTKQPMIKRKHGVIAATCGAQRAENARYSTRQRRQLRRRVD